MNAEEAQARTGAAEPPGGARSKQQERRAGEPRLHDFTHSEALPRPVVQALERVCSSLARGASAGLSADLREQVRVLPESLTQVTYDQYVQTAPDPTIAVTFRMSPLPGRGLLQLDTSLGMRIIEQLLGGRGEGAAAARALTMVEKALLEGTVARLLAELGTAFEALARFQPEVAVLVDSIRTAEVAKPMEAMAVAGFEMQIASVTGKMAICLPAISLKMGGAVEASAAGLSDDKVSLREMLGASLRSLPLTCVVRLGQARISAAELAALAEGDVLSLDTAASADLEMLVAGRAKFRCGPVRYGSRMAVKIVDRV